MGRGSAAPGAAGAFPPPAATGVSANRVCRMAIIPLNSAVAGAAADFSSHEGSRCLTYGTYACTSHVIFSPFGFRKYGDFKAGQSKE